MKSIAETITHVAIEEHHLTRDVNGKVIATPKMVYDHEKGYLMFDAPAEQEDLELPGWDTDTMAQHQLWLTHLATVYETARGVLPENLERLERGKALVEAGAVTPTDDPRTWMVRSESQPEKRYRVAASCRCEDYQYAPGRWCKHRLAAALYQRTMQAFYRGDPPKPQAPPVDAAPGTAASLPHPDLEAAILERYTYEAKGVRAIRYAGLLLIAKGRGLTSLKVLWTSNAPELALASACATFADGSTWTESGDATPQNVSKLVAPHFRRMALTRAKARALRDALGIDMVAFEELGEL